MILTIILVILSISALIILHEFGHFIIAKKFGVKVEEFGIGYPPRIFGKKIGETIYSINLLPLGGFVKILGEEERKNDPKSFSSKPLWQRSLIILGGVINFWIIAIVLFSIVFSMGAPVAVGDNEVGNFTNPHIEILSVQKDSPAEKAGLQMGDIIEKFKVGDKEIAVNKVANFLELTKEYSGQEVGLVVKRGKEDVSVNLVPRVSPPPGQGAMGISLARVAFQSYSFPRSIWMGIKYTGVLTARIFVSLGQLFYRLIRGQGMPAGMEPASILGIFYFFYKAAQLGTIYFLQFVAMISVYLAVFNILPIPALDGGKLLFLGIEGIRKKPISQKIENNITLAFFVLLIALVVFVTFRFDIPRFIK